MIKKYQENRVYSHLQNLFSKEKDYNPGALELAFECFSSFLNILFQLVRQNLRGARVKSDAQPIGIETVPDPKLDPDEASYLA